MATFFTVLHKEIKDTLRDRRTLAVVLISSILMGPLLLVALSHLLANLEMRAEQRVVVVAALEQSPSLHNFLLRQAYTVEAAPPDYEAQLRSGQWGQAVLVVPPDFDPLVQRGEQPALTLITDSSNRASQANAAKLQRLLQGYLREHVTLSLLLQGVPMQIFEPLQIHLRDLASQQSRAAQLTSMLPFFVIMAVLYGALNAALDTTAGERERGSLVPLLMNPASRWALVLGKWAAVVGVAMLVATLSALSFWPSQWLLQSETLQSMFQFGLVEALWFIAILFPLALMLSAGLMAVAMRCKSFKEAQASSSVLVLLTSMLPMVSMFGQDGEAFWYLWVPALAQHTLMTRVLRGQVLGVDALVLPWLVALVCASVSVLVVVRSLRVAGER
jgi:sodium transport system permease protein